MINTTYNITFSSKFTGCRGAGACVPYVRTVIHHSHLLLFSDVVSNSRRVVAASQHRLCFSPPSSCSSPSLAPSSFPPPFS